MNIDKIINLITIAGKGLLLGFGMGALLFGLLFVSIAFKNGQELNAAALLPIFSGVFLMFLGSKSNKYTAK